MSTETVTVRGPLFNGVASDEAAAYTRDVLDQVSAQARSEWSTNLDGSIRHPTPYYETQINIRDEPPDTKVVNDRGVIYGWWLEGIGSRNQSTRFKGYWARRRAIAALETKVPGLLERVLQRYLPKMRGL